MSVVEVNLVIGIVACAECPPPQNDMGVTIFSGIFSPQGSDDNTLMSYEKFYPVIPGDMSGSAAIQVAHTYLFSTGVSLFFKLSIYVIDSAKSRVTATMTDYATVTVQISPGSSVSFNIHPSSDKNKCVDIRGGIYADGTPVDMYVTLLICSF